MATAPTTEIQVQRFVDRGQTCETKFAKSLRVSATWSMQTHLIRQYGYGRELIDVPGELGVTAPTGDRPPNASEERPGRWGPLGLALTRPAWPDTWALADTWELTL